MNASDLRALLLQAARLAADLPGMDKVSELLDNAYLALDEVPAAKFERMEGEFAVYSGVSL